VYREAEDVPIGGSGRNQSRGKRAAGERGRSPAGASSGIVTGRDTKGMARAELADLVQQLSDQMLGAARDLQFELAARLRDEIQDLKKELRGMDAAGVS
jgi:excinuclease ABC subunit B